MRPPADNKPNRERQQMPEDPLRAGHGLSTLMFRSNSEHAGQPLMMLSKRVFSAFKASISAFWAMYPPVNPPRWFKISRHFRQSSLVGTPCSQVIMVRTKDCQPRETDSD